MILELLAWALAALLVGLLVAAYVMRRGHGKAATHDTTGKVMVVTGGNSGIGLATATALARGGGTVVITARARWKADEAVATIRHDSGNADVHAVLLDLASLASVRHAAAEILDRWPRLDVLVNNAGAVVSRPQETEDGFELTIGANHLGPFLLTELLTPRLVASAPARIVNVASAAHGVGDLRLDDLHFRVRPYAQMVAYGTSKLANILHAIELSRRLADQGVTANSVHPGTIRSGFGRGDETGIWWKVGLAIYGPLMASPEQGAATVVRLAADPSLATVSGEYWSRSRPVTPASAALDEDLAAALWEHSAELVDAP